MAQTSSPHHPQRVAHHLDTVVAVQPSAYQNRTAPGPNPVPDYMCYSIFTTLCCCMILGIVALNFSCNARKASKAGNRAEAAKNSRTALNLNHVSVFLGIIFITAYVIYRVNHGDKHPY